MPHTARIEPAIAASRRAVELVLDRGHWESLETQFIRELRLVIDAGKEREFLADS